MMRPRGEPTTNIPLMEVEINYLYMLVFIPME